MNSVTDKCNSMVEQLQTKWFNVSFVTVSTVWIISLYRCFKELDKRTDAGTVQWLAAFNHWIIGSCFNTESMGEKALEASGNHYVYCDTISYEQCIILWNVPDRRNDIKGISQVQIVPG